MVFADRHSGGKGNKVVGVLLLGFVSVIGLWAVRNTLLQGKVSVVITQGGTTLLMGNPKTTDLNRAWDLFTLHGERPIFRDLPKVPPDGSMWTEGKKEKRVQQKVILLCAGHPADHPTQCCQVCTLLGP